MRVLIMGNSGSGKTFLAKKLETQHGLLRLDLDTIVWEKGAVAVLRPAGEVQKDLERFLAENGRWVIEGCYGELIQAAAPAATDLYFLNPGLEACLANNRRRPWESHKYSSPAEQNKTLPMLLEWTASYYTRQDPWSFAAHRRIFEGFRGRKSEIYEAEFSDDEKPEK